MLLYPSLRIQNFRCLEDLELKDLARVNLLGGQNNIGKTAVLEAILLHSGNFRPELILRQLPHLKPDLEGLFYKYDRAEAIRIDNGLDIKLSICIRFLDKIDLTLTSEELMIAFRASKYLPKDTPSMNPIYGQEALELVYSQNDGQPYRGAIFQVRADNPGVQSIVPVLRPRPIFFIARPEDDDHKEFYALFSQLVLDGQRGRLVESLQILEPRLKHLEAAFEATYADIGLKRPLPVATMGLGMNRLMNFVLAIASAAGGAVLIDEIETGLHYSSMAKVWQVLHQAAKEFDVQIFATSHSSEMIKAAHEAFSQEGDYDFRYYLLAKNREGRVGVGALGETSLGTAIQMELEVR
jgi:hypothetical protein